MAHTAAAAVLPSPSGGRGRRVVLLRHGQSEWNAAGRVQGRTDESGLTALGRTQAERCAAALSRASFPGGCLASPLRRAAETAGVVWSGRPGAPPVRHVAALREADLTPLQGLTSQEAAARYPGEFRAWRERPAEFSLRPAGPGSQLVYPVHELFREAREAWGAVLGAEAGGDVLVVTHKSMLRAMLCTSLGLGPESFRAFDVDNGGLVEVAVGPEGEVSVRCVNATAHMHNDGVLYYAEEGEETAEETSSMVEGSQVSNAAARIRR